MPRLPRTTIGGLVYHVLNRAASRRPAVGLADASESATEREGVGRASPQRAAWRTLRPGEMGEADGGETRLGQHASPPRPAAKGEMRGLAIWKRFLTPLRSAPWPRALTTPAIDVPGRPALSNSQLSSGHPVSALVRNRPLKRADSTSPGKDLSLAPAPPPRAGVRFMGSEERCRTSGGRPSLR